MDAGHGAGRDASAAIGSLKAVAKADSFHHLKGAMASRYTLERELGAGGMATGGRDRAVTTSRGTESGS